MSFSINEAKLEELLRSSKEGYAISTSSVGGRMENYSPLPAYSEVSGTCYIAPILITAETKNELMALRRRIEESGNPLQNAEQLTSEIDEMRGRR